MAIPINKEEDNAILDAVKQHQLVDPWIGLVRRYDKKFFTVYGLKPIYTNWLPQNPDNHHDEEDYGHYWGGRLQYLAWNDNVCLKNFSFICELKRS